MSFFSLKKFIVLVGLVSLIFVFSFKQAEAACNTAPSINTNPIPPFRITDTAGSDVAYNVNVRNNDDTSCAAASRTFTLTSTNPGAGWTDSFDSITLTVNKGGGINSTVYRLTSPAAIATGNYKFTITASDGNRNNLARNGIRQYGDLESGELRAIDANFNSSNWFKAQNEKLKAAV